MKKILALIMAVVLVLSLGVLAGCEKKEDAAAGSNASGTESAPASKGTIVVGYTIYAPMNYFDENNKLIGFDTELAEKVFTNMGYEVQFKEINWDNKYTDLDGGTIDCVWNGFTANTSDKDGIARKDKVDFSYNYMENRQVVVVNADSGITDAAALSGKIGCAEGGSAGLTYAESFEGTSVKSVLKQTDGLFEVKSGTADFVVLDAQVAKAYVGKGDYAGLTVVDALSSDVEFYAIGFKKGSALTAEVNAQLEALAADGTIAALAEKYGVANTAITDFADQK